MTVPRIPPLSEFQIPEEKAERVALALGSIWNQGAGIVSTLQKGESWSLFFKVCGLVVGIFSVQICKNLLI